MERVPGEDLAAQRARWLAELSEALDEARRLMKRLGAAEGQMEIVELYARIEAIRLEIEAIRLGRRYAASNELDPKWIGFIPWQMRCGNDS
jgi:hypothetical protein